jgi:hypothetical protein
MSHSDPSQEQSRFERFGVIGIARRGEQTRIESYISAQVVNIDQSDAYMESDVPIDVGRNVSVWLYSSAQDGKKEEFFGVLKWKKELDDPFSARYGYGIQLQSE